MFTLETLLFRTWKAKVRSKAHYINGKTSIDFNRLCSWLKLGMQPNSLSLCQDLA